MTKSQTALEKQLLNFTIFAEKFLKIRTKSGAILPFKLNKAQLYIHNTLENQLKDTGKVRAVILKGRQQGCSTLIGGRFAHKVITRRGMKAFILTHEQDATTNLFEITKRYVENLPYGLCPKPDASAANKLYFKSFDSGYAVGTAGNKAVGRSQTIQLLHACIAEGSKVYNPKTGGIKNIEEFEIGDSILTHTGKLAEISYISNQEKECLSVKLRTTTTFPLIATPEHKVWTKEGFKELRELKIGDEIGYPVREIANNIREFILPASPKRDHGGGNQGIYKNFIQATYEFGRLIGLYLAEGYIALQDKEPKLPSLITFTVHRNECDRTIEWLRPFEDYYSSMKIVHRKNCLTSTVTIYGNRFAQLILNLCGRTKNKHVPINWQDMGRDFCKGILHGYLSGDGSSYENTRKISAPSICHAITVSIRDLAASLGYGWASILYREGAIRHGRNEKSQYTFYLCGDGASKLASEINKPSLNPVRKKCRHSSKPNAAITTEISNGYAWLRIRKIENAAKKNVYDFEVNHQDHSYCLIQGAVSNSEVAFWANADEHAKGVLQAVSRSAGTEIIMESTANGIGNFYHSQWVSAINGESEYIPIFVPWYWQPEYTATPIPKEWNDDEKNLLEKYRSDGLTPEHMAWRRFKIAEFRDPEQGINSFKQEYPFTWEEAFRSPIENSYINSASVTEARKREVESDSALILGIDPAIGDNDRTVICRRKGRKVLPMEWWRSHTTMESAGRIRNIIDNEQPVKVFIDVIGIGAGVVDRLHEEGYHMVEGVNASNRASERLKYANKRAELYSMVKEYLEGDLPVELPDDDGLHGELCNIGIKPESGGRLLLEGKVDIKKRGLPSPDKADALALTFAGGHMISIYSMMPSASDLEFARQHKDKFY